MREDKHTLVHVYVPRMRVTVIVLAILVIAILVAFSVGRFVPHSRDLFFVAAVVVVSRYAGAAAGLIVSLVAVFLFDWFFDSTPHVLDFSVGALVLGFVSVLVASIEQHRRSAMERLEKSNRTLLTALEEIKTLRGLLPICSYCKKIETDEQTWVEIEEYVRKHSHAEFSHGLCPTCYRKHYPELYNQRFGPNMQS
jgi:K+-sensing histidine kinase KdpD